MSKSRMNKIKSSNSNNYSEDNFFVSLEEARASIMEQYDFLQDRYERSKLSRKKNI